MRKVSVFLESVFVCECLLHVIRFHKQSDAICPFCYWPTLTTSFSVYVLLFCSNNSILSRFDVFTSVTVRDEISGLFDQVNSDQIDPSAQFSIISFHHFF